MQLWNLLVSCCSPQWSGIFLTAWIFVEGSPWTQGQHFFRSIFQRPLLTTTSHPNWRPSTQFPCVKGLVSGHCLLFPKPFGTPSWETLGSCCCCPSLVQALRGCSGNGGMQKDLTAPIFLLIQELACSPCLHSRWTQSWNRQRWMRMCNFASLEP